GPLAAVRAIIADVRTRGDAAVREYTERFDGAKIDSLVVDAAELDVAWRGLDPVLREALEVAAEAITGYHREQRRADARHAHAGIVVTEMARPVARAGLYVPGGRARYPSTVLMTALPARVAGGAEPALC